MVPLQLEPEAERTSLASIFFCFKKIFLKTSNFITNSSIFKHRDRGCFAQLFLESIFNLASWVGTIHSWLQGWEAGLPKRLMTRPQPRRLWAAEGLKGR